VDNTDRLKAMSTKKRRIFRDLPESAGIGCRTAFAAAIGLSYKGLELVNGVMS
jgi:Holliday junction resolvasome RuvABC DNA-binding subunit